MREKLSNYDDMALICCEMYGCPIIKATVIDVSNKILKLGGVQKSFELFKVPVLSCPQEILIVALFILPPIAPSICFGCICTDGLTLLR